MRYFLFFLLSILFIQQGIAQRHCGTQELLEQKKKSHPELYRQQTEFIKTLTEKSSKSKSFKGTAGEDVYNIPVVVHVIHKNSAGTIAGTNISYEQIASQIRILNEDFRRMAGTRGFNTHPSGADVKIEFCLASRDPFGNYTNGIQRVYNSKTSWSLSFSDETTLKGLSYWPSDQYLNIWVCDLESPYLGYAQLPSGTPLPGLGGDPGAATDGVVIDYKYFGDVGTATSPYNLGRTTTHEVGHWLGLIHIWGDANCGDDHVADTPTDAGPNNDLNCSDQSDCDGDLVFTPDMTNNYMDYSTDVCMNLYTEGQKTRMRTAMETSPRRMSLLNSLGCCLSSAGVLPFLEDFESSALTISIKDNNSNITWQTSSPGSYSESTTSILMKNDSANVSEKDYLITPNIAFTGEKPMLAFDLAYAQDPSSGSDTLVVSYSTDCSNYTELTRLSASTLITTSTVTDNFIPSATDWKRIRVNLGALNNIPAVRFRFENISGKKENLYIDNINIYKTSPELVIEPYPNPASEILKVNVILESEQDVTFELFDLLGQKLAEWKDYNKSSYTKSINVSGFTRGMYILRVGSNNKFRSTKVLLNY